MGHPPFQALAVANSRDVARFARTLVGPDEADDVAQRVWLQALCAYPHLKHADDLRAWLLTITARVAIDTHRERARRPVPVADLGDACAGVTDPPSPRDTRLWALLGELPERQRAAVLLHHALGVPHKEVAVVLGCSAEVSRRLACDGLIRLRRWYLGRKPPAGRARVGPGTGPARRRGRPGPGRPGFGFGPGGCAAAA